MTQIKTAWLVASVSFLVTGCFTSFMGQEAGRIPLTAPGQYQAKITVDPDKPIRFWTDLDVEFQGNALLLYRIELRDGNRLAGRLDANPFDVTAKVMSREVSINDNHSLRYLGRMEGSLPAPGTDTITVLVTLEAAGTFSEMKKMDLVLRQ